MVCNFGIGIVTYNPNIEKLRRCIESIYRAGYRLVVADNGSNNIEEIQKIVSKCSLIEIGENKGIAYALNLIMENYKDKEVEWVLTLDQDTELHSEIVDILLPYTSYQKVGIVCGMCNERGSSKNKSNCTDEIDEIDYCITAGSLTKVSVWDEVGRYDDDMFIDFVDFELCSRVKEYGYKIIRVNSASFLQEVGNLREVILGPKVITLREYSPIRYYYYARNARYCARKMAQSSMKKMMRRSNLVKIIKIVLFEDNKFEKTRAFFRGLHDASNLMKTIPRKTKYRDN